MFKLSKKTWITIGAISAPVVAFAIGVPVAISKRTIVKGYKVSLFSANGPRYFVTDFDAKQNKPRISKIDIWDVDQKDKNQIDAVAKELGIKSNFVVPTLRKTSNYSNGLEKFLYDFIKAKDNADAVSIIFRTKYNIFSYEAKETDASPAKKVNVAGDLEIAFKNYIPLSLEDRAKKFASWYRAVFIDKNNVTKTVKIVKGKNVYQITIKSKEAELLNALQAVKLAKQDSKGNWATSNTDASDIAKAFNKIKNNLKINIPDLVPPKAKS